MKHRLLTTFAFLMSLLVMPVVVHSSTGSKSVTATPDGAPSITSSTSGSGTVLSDLNYTITATNTPTSYGATNLPPGLAINTGSGLITGTPNTAGAWQATVSATNGSGTGTAQVTFTIADAVPFVVGSTNDVAVVGVPYQYQIGALNKTTSFGASPLPDGLGIDTNTGLISGTPTTTGSTLVSISATNTAGTYSTSLNITVIASSPSPIVVSNSNDSGAGSLRDAITTANNQPGSTITFNGVSGTILLASDLPVITASTTITGPGAQNLTIDGATAYQGLYVQNGVVSISGLTITDGINGITVGQGATAQIDQCAITNNTSSGFPAGGVDCSGIATITNSTISGNTAPYGGGGVISDGIVNVSNSTISTNTSPQGGGGFECHGLSAPSRASILNLTSSVIQDNGTSGGNGGAIESLGRVTVTGCTFNGNSCEGAGGAITTAYVATISNSMFTNNTANFYGAAVEVSGSAEIDNCTITGNTSPSAPAVDGNQYASSVVVKDCTIVNNSSTSSGGAAVVIGWYDNATLKDNILWANQDNQNADHEILTAGSMILSVDHCDVNGGYAGTGNINMDPMLGALGNYAGTTETYSLLPGSPCLGGGVDSGLSTDERGVGRQGRFDIGAFESQGFIVTPTSGNSQSTYCGTAFPHLLIAKITAIDGVDPVQNGVVTFSAPITGASAAIAGSPATIGGDGTVTVTATANYNAGAYYVTANTGAGSGLFHLANVPHVTFAGVDTTTQGNWKDRYGVGGFDVIGDPSPLNPHYTTGVSVTPGAHNSGLWTASSLSPACLQTTASGNPNRLAGVWYQTSWTINVNLTGTQHALALYLLDQPNAGYAETITIKDAVTGDVLNTQTASSFAGGKYYIWNVTGNVNVTLTSTAGHWAVLSGIFIGGATGSKSPTQPTNLVASPTASGIGLSWSASTGATSYNIYRGTTAGGESTTPIATGIKTTSFTNTGLVPHTYYYKVVAVNSYAGSFASGEASATAPSPTSTATFVKADTTTQGTWKGVYGLDGYNVIGDSSGTNPVYPSYATVTAGAHNSGIWTASSTAANCLQKVATNSTTRIAGLWYQTTWSMNVDVTGMHQLALYLLDFPNAGYAETITIKDAATGIVLDTRSASSFNGGVYEVWNVSGNVTITLTSTAGHWAPVSGIFFG